MTKTRGSYYSGYGNHCFYFQNIWIQCWMWWIVRPVKQIFVFSCTLVSHGNFSWPYMMVICFTVLWFVMIASAIVLHHQLKKSGRSLRNSLNRRDVAVSTRRANDQLKASINRLESGMTKRVVIMVISYTLLYLPCKYQYSTILCKFWLIWSRYLY